MRMRAFGRAQALAPCSAGEDERTGRHRHAVADGLHVGADVLHRVIDREARMQRAAGGVHVHGDILVGVVGLEVNELGDHQVRELVVDGLADEDDALVQEP